MIDVCSVYMYNKYECMGISKHANKGVLAVYIQSNSSGFLWLEKIGRIIRKISRCVVYTFAYAAMLIFWPHGIHGACASPPCTESRQVTAICHPLNVDVGDQAIQKA